MNFAPPKVRYFTGLDVGQTGEFTALAVLEKTREFDRDGVPVGSKYAVRHLERFPMGTPLTEVSARVVGSFADPPLRNSWLLVDITGVGLPIIRELGQRGVQAGIRAISITKGYAATSDANGLQVPMKELVTTLQLLLQSHRLHIAQSLPDAPILVRELASFSMKKVSLVDHDGILWRERPHDDLVLAVAIAAWMGERWIEPYIEGPLFLSPQPEPDTVSGLLSRIVREMEWDD